jgi:hypothetical protein
MVTYIIQLNVVQNGTFNTGDRHSGPVIQARSIQALGLNVV